MRNVMNISNNKWYLWLDKDAQWVNDTLYTPEETDINKIPVNAPTIGWNSLWSQSATEVTLPACVEEFFSQEVNDWLYHGVSWYYTELDIPAETKGKRVTLYFEKTRLRAEIYINGRLAGYDLVSETPYEVDITSYVHYSKSNKVAIRITNPGGTRGWNDLVSYQWGGNEMLPSHDFSVVGHIHLVITDKTYIEDVFVKNNLPALGNNVDVISEIYSPSKKEVEIIIDILDAKNGNSVYQESGGYRLVQGLNTITQSISVPKAHIWDLETPQLYYCRVKLIGTDSGDEVCERFGFRVFEVKEASNGNAHFYLNGKRFRHKSAIDWGYYAHTGAYATEEMAERSVKAAKEIGHNGINFHRQIGEPLVMEKADELGLYMYEEPGGIKTGDLPYLLKKVMGNKQKVFEIEKNPLVMALFEERLKRMVKRDRNHPSLLIYTMSNEDKKFTKYRAKMLKLVNDMDDSRFIANGSGSNCLSTIIELMKARKNASVLTMKESKVLKKYRQYSYKPYSNIVTRDHVDMHTVEAKAMFQEEIFNSHKLSNGKATRYWGEVACYCGPANWYKSCEDQKNLQDQRSGYDNNIYKGMHDKLVENYDNWNLQDSCAGAIQGPEDVSKQAGRGLMYIDGRFCQTMCSYNGLDGFAINGWSSGPQVTVEDEARGLLDWDSAIVDEARNLKGPAEDYAYWTRKAQIAIFRSNGKYFKPNDIANFRMVLINEGEIEKGNYTLQVKAYDSQGKIIHVVKNRVLSVDGGDIFSQELEGIKVDITSAFAHGYITVEAVLLNSKGGCVADGKEQILINNLPSCKKSIKALAGSIYNCEKAHTVMESIGLKVEDYKEDKAYDYIIGGQAPSNKVLKSMLEQVHKGTKLIIQFNKSWAQQLYEARVLSQPVTEWGCKQEGFWYGNGWGYISEYVDETVPSGKILSTNSWQPTGDPQGFYPFSSKYKQNVFGLWMARHDVMRVTLGSITYGQGKIILNPSYDLDVDDILSTMMLHNMIIER